MASSRLILPNCDLHSIDHSSGMGVGMMRGAASVSGGSDSSASASATHCGP